MDIAKEYGIPVSTLSTYLKNKEKILERSSSDGSKKRKRDLEFPKIEQRVNWFKEMRSCNVVTSDPVVQGKAEEFAKMLVNDQFKGSVRCLERFNERNRISFKQICVERASLVQEDFD